MRALIIAALLLQPGPRPPLAPAETLIEPAILKAIVDAPVDIQQQGPAVIAGSDAGAGEIVVISPAGKGIVADAGLQKLNHLIEAKAVPRPPRSIRFLTSRLNTFRISDLPPPQSAKAALMVVDYAVPTRQVIRGLWSTASVADEVVEIFASHASGTVEFRSYRDVGQPRWDGFGIPTTTLLTGENTEPFTEGAVIVAASVYFLATLPNAGSEALLSHLTVGAHARLAEDGRRAVAMMGNQQRAGADVLIFFGQAIEREQRRMRSFTRFMPEPVDPMLQSRIAEMARGITAIWTSIGITSSPFVPAAERLRGRGGEDRRVPSKTGADQLKPIEPPTALLKYANLPDILYELGNLIDGKRSISDIRDVLSAEFGPMSLPVIVDYFERLAKSGVITLG